MNEPGSIEITWFTILAAYGILINLYAFFIFGFDKARSTQSNTRRIRERTLWISMVLGGSLGALLGMHLFRHKTKKLSFQAVAAVILMAQVLLFLYFYTTM